MHPEESRFIEEVRLTDEIQRNEKSKAKYTEEYSDENGEFQPWVLDEIAYHAEEAEKMRTQLDEERARARLIENTLEEIRLLEIDDFSNALPMRRNVVSIGTHMLDLSDIDETIIQRSIELGISPEEYKKYGLTEYFVLQYKDYIGRLNADKLELETSVATELDVIELLLGSGLETNEKYIPPTLLEGIKTFEISQVIKSETNISMLGVGMDGIVIRVELPNNNKIAIKITNGLGADNTEFVDTLVDRLFPDIDENKVLNELPEYRFFSSKAELREHLKADPTGIFGKSLPEDLAAGNYLGNKVAPGIVDKPAMVSSGDKPVGIILPDYNIHNDTGSSKFLSFSSLHNTFTREESLAVSNESKKLRKTGILVDTGKSGVDVQNFVVLPYKYKSGSPVVRFFDLRLHYKGLLNKTAEEIIGATGV